MGTRALTHFAEKYDHEEVILCTLYRQMDGYPDSHGKALAELLNGYKIVNGINSQDEKTCPKLANGIGCLAAQVIGHFKSDTSHYEKMQEVAKLMADQFPNDPGFREQLLKAPIKRKYRVGMFYMHPAGDDGGVDYIYTVYTDKDRNLFLRLETHCPDKVVLFDGRPEDYSLELIQQKQAEFEEQL